jgi:hypothetical protein
MTVRHEGS